LGRGIDGRDAEEDSAGTAKRFAYIAQRTTVVAIATVAIP
jgi:hypothetical protein